MKRRKLSLGLLCVIAFYISGCKNYDGRGKLFRLLNSKDTGIDFNNSLEETHTMNIISYPDFYSGGGVSIGDIDNDGLSDIFFTANQEPSRLYRNMGGMVFEDITESAGLDKMGRGWYTGTCMVDLNADGYMDIYVSKSGMEAPDDRANLLFINNRDGTFSEQSESYGLNNQGFGVNAVFFDYDRDGDLDAYVANQVSSRLNSSDAEKLRRVIDPFAGDKLYENIGNKFVDVSEASGIYSSKVGFAHGVAVGDINGDGWEDIYVSNDFFEYDYLYLNNGDKTFTERIRNWTRHISNFSMGNDLADFNNDGLLDLVVLDMVAEDNRRLYSNTGGMNEQRFRRSIKHGLHYQYMFNMLHMNNGNETFSEIGMLAGISRTDWSWAPILADFDNDGLKDLFVTNGIRKDIRNIDWGVIYRNMTQFVSDFTEFEESQWDMLLGALPFEPVQNYMFRNNGDLTFTKVMDEWGLDHKSYSNGAAYGDLDNDGDLDLVINNVDNEAFVYENKSKAVNFIRFTFKGSEKNPMGLGTKVRIFHGKKFQYQQHYVSRGYRSSMEPVMHFGIGKDTTVRKLVVVWPDNKFYEIDGLRANQVVLLDYADAVDGIPESWDKEGCFFDDVTDQLGLSVHHRENEMIEFIRDPLLPYKLSTLGPSLAVADVNGDGLDDFFLGGAFRYPGQLCIQTPEGKFESVQKDLWDEERLFEDTGAEFFDLDNDGDQDLYVVSGGMENTLKNGGLRDRIYLNDGSGKFVRSKDRLPEFFNCGSVVRSADFDGDGDLDLFVGGRMIPDRYPMPASSYLLMNQGGKLEIATDRIAPELNHLGLVTDAIWSDYDTDNDLDLMIVGEWMPVTIFENRSGKLSKVKNSNNGLDFSSGWWWSIHAHDIDRDGDQDYTVGNIGLNYKFRASAEEPLELYAGYFDLNDKVDFAIGYHQDGKVFPISDRSKSIQQTPGIKSSIPSNDQYAMATIQEIYGKEILDSALNEKIYTLKSGILENTGNGKFTFKPFDSYAQMSNINSAIFSDVDHDGDQDIILAGNLYTMEAETIRLDAGIGVWARNDGNGNFTSVPYKGSGLYLNGDIRDMEELRTASKQIVLVAKNNDRVQAISVKPLPVLGKEPN